MKNFEGKVNVSDSPELFAQLEPDTDKTEFDPNDTESILNGKTAKYLLPRLTLENLSDQEKANIIAIADHFTSHFATDTPDQQSFPGSTKSAYYLEQAKQDIAELAMKHSASSKEAVTRHAEACKLLAAAVIDAHGNPNLSLPDDELNDALRLKPGILAYCSAEDLFELIPIANNNTNRHPENSSCSSLICYMLEQRIKTEARIDPNNTNSFFKRIKQKSRTPAQQLSSLLSYYEFVNHSSFMQQDFMDSISDFCDNPDAAPLVRITGHAIQDSIRDINLTPRDFLAPNFSTSYFDKRISESDLDSDSVSIMSAIYHPYAHRKGYFDTGRLRHSYLHDYINRAIGTELADIPIESQAQLLKFMATPDIERFNKLRNVLRSTNQKLRPKLLETFVLVDFGEDFGDSLLEIAKSERLSSSEKAEIFDTIISCHHSIQEITSLYEHLGESDTFAKEYSRAANERLTDVITVFREIANTGVAQADLGWAGQPSFNYDSAMEALNYEAKSLEIISGTLKDVQDHKDGAFAEVVLTPDPSSARQRRTIYCLYSPDHGYVLMHTRPEGSNTFDASVEYGKRHSRYNADGNAGTEASIGLTANPVNPFSLPNPFKPDQRAMHNPHFYDPRTMDKVSAIRLDREGRTTNMAADAPERDPTNIHGSVSVDLAAIGDRADTPSGKIARLISVGNKIRNDQKGVDYSLNHNNNWFSQDKYGSAKGFSEVVEYIDNLALQWCADLEPPVNADSYSKLKRQQRGRRALRHSA